MPAERFYFDQLLIPDDRVKLIGPEFHHLVRVMRAQVGDVIELVNGKNQLAQAHVYELTKNEAILQVQTVYPNKPTRHPLILAQALTKLNRLDFILEKGTELGVTAFWLFPGDLSIKKDFSSQQMERAQALTIAAMKQCGRLSLPTIELKPPLKQWKPQEGISFFGDVSPTAPKFESFKSQLASQNPILFVTGPESGFSLKEVEQLRKIHVQGVKLHPFILRTDTASMMALSLLSHWLMET